MNLKPAVFAALVLTTALVAGIIPSWLFAGEAQIAGDQPVPISTYVSAVRD